MVLDIQAKAWKPRAEWAMYVTPVRSKNLVWHTLTTLHRGVAADLDHFAPPLQVKWPAAFLSEINDPSFSFVTREAFQPSEANLRGDAIRWVQ
jgi:hypothetical protein